MFARHPKKHASLRDTCFTGTNTTLVHKPRLPKTRSPKLMPKRPNRATLSGTLTYEVTPVSSEQPPPHPLPPARPGPFRSCPRSGHPPATAHRDRAADCLVESWILSPYNFPTLIKMVSIKLSKKTVLGVVIFLTTAVSFAPARADEVWGSDYGKVVYQADRGKTAIWTYGDNSNGTFFIDGLAGQFKDRGTYYGYWSQSTSKVKCETYREGRDGRRTYYWGNLRIQFHDPTFPSRWSAKIGYCNQPPKLPWRAYPIVGDGLIEPLTLP